MQVFKSTDAHNINSARIAHLDRLALDFKNKTVLETGCGPLGAFTTWLEKYEGIDITSTDARQDLLDLHHQNSVNKNRKLVQCDLNTDDVLKLGKFDVIFSYGLLYHLNKPELFIKNMANMCNDFMVLSTCVNHADNGQMNLVAENKGTANQAFDGMGCRPGRDWLFSELKKHFEYVYISKSQPKHPDFRLKFPATNMGRLARCVFVASKTPIDNAELSDVLVDEFVN